MQVTVKSLKEEEIERRDYRDILSLSIDGKRIFIVMDGEPEDSNLSRDFNDCWAIPDLMKLAHTTGLNAEPFLINEELVSVDDI